VTPFWKTATRPDPSQPVQAPRTALSPLTGPRDAGDPGVSTEGFLDLGALRLPARKDLKIRLDVDKNSGTVAAVTVQADASSVQLTVFAAPRSSGVWDDVRPEIAAAVSGGGGATEEREGSFGTELVARVPTTLPTGGRCCRCSASAAWTGRAGSSGRSSPAPRCCSPSAPRCPEELASRARGEDLESLVREVVVVRGSDPMAPREPLPLRVPETARRVSAAGPPAAVPPSGEQSPPPGTNTP
jgi:hypothetical protein